MEQENPIFLAAERLLAGRIMSEKELEKKLLKKFPNERETIQKILEKCQEYGFLNDQKYAEIFVKYERERAPQSDFLLRNKLKEKGISEKILDVVFSENLSNEEEILEKLILRKIKTLPIACNQQKKKERLFRFALGRGFSFSLVRKIIEKILKQEK